MRFSVRRLLIWQGWVLLAVLLGWVGLPEAVSKTQALVFEADREYVKGNLDQALDLFRRAVAANPKHRFSTFARNRVALILAKQGKISDALHLFETVQKIDTKNTFALLWVGILRLKRGEMDHAFKVFQEVIRIDPQNADAYYYIGAIYNFRRNRRAAIEFLKKARDADSDEADTHFRLAQAFHNADMVENALLEYQRTLNLQPRYIKAINSMGWIYYNRNQFKRAIKLWRKSLRLNPKNREARFNLAKAYNDAAWRYHQSGQRNEARRFWRKTLRVHPRNKAAKWNLKNIR